jgi:hypothetical protein
MAGRQFQSDGVRYILELSDITLYVPFETLERVLVGADDASLTDKQRALIDEFGRVVERRRTGLPDDPLHLEHDDE